MYIKNLDNGEVRLYGTNPFDSLLVSNDGRTLKYCNLLDGGNYRFVTGEEGFIPSEDPEFTKNEGIAVFNIGGFDRGDE